MEIKNAKIKKATVAFDKFNQRDKLAVRITFEDLGDLSNWSFSLSNPLNIEYLAKLMSYTGTDEIQKLKGKNVRVAIHHGCICGLGHPIEDKFVSNFSSLGITELGHDWEAAPFTAWLEKDWEDILGGHYDDYDY